MPSHFIGSKIVIQCINNKLINGLNYMKKALELDSISSGFA
jgi:hypothetical protein